MACVCAGPGTATRSTRNGRTTMFQIIEPSELIEFVLGAVVVNPSAVQGMRMVMARETEFGSRLAAQLTGIALDPTGRQIAEQAMDAYWAERPRQERLQRQSSAGRE